MHDQTLSALSALATAASEYAAVSWVAPGSAETRRAVLPNDDDEENPLFVDPGSDKARVAAASARGVAASRTVEFVDAAVEFAAASGSAGKYAGPDGAVRAGRAGAAYIDASTRHAAAVAGYILAAAVATPETHRGGGDEELRAVELRLDVAMNAYVLSATSCACSYVGGVIASAVQHWSAGVVSGCDG